MSKSKFINSNCDSIKFLFDENGIMNNNFIDLHEDGSFGRKLDYINKETWDFQIMIELPHSGVLLNIDSFSNKCTSVEGWINKKQIKQKEVDIFDYRIGSLFISSNINKELFGLSVKLKNNNIYYDNSKGILLVGEINSKQPLLKFGNGQYIKLNKDKEIECIIIQFCNL